MHKLKQSWFWLKQHYLYLLLVFSLFLSTAGVYFFWAVQLPARRYELPAGLSLYSRGGALLHSYLNENDQLLIPVKLDAVHSNVLAALVASEDQRFYSHYGVDPQAVVRAALTNLEAGQIKSGASTITMQLTRMVDPAPRTFYNKFVESLRALALDFRWSKRRILQAYVNRLPFGGNIKGIETAARIYFDKAADNLSVAQAAYLTAIPKDPVRLNPLRHHARVKKKQREVLRRMWAEGFLDRRQYQQSLAASVRPARHPLPFRAPHLTELLRLRGVSGHTKTTLDLAFQEKIKAIVNDYKKGLEAHEVHNLAVVVLANETREVLAYLGSQDYFDNRHGGQNQGPYALRSPGSALKPFLYLKAFADGHITPRRMLVDVPTRYIGLAPENYDREFRGRVSAARALKQSLNVPAVRLLNHYGLHNYKQFLEKLGFDHMDHEAEYYGLGLVLGGVGVNLMELTNAYATLANRGIHRAPHFRLENDSSKKRLYKAAAPYLISRVLKVEESVFGAFPFAYKTGTSADHRDAWTVGWNPEITVGVWTGNFDGSPARYLLGRRTAFPLVKKIFRARYPAKSGPWFDRPDRVGKRPVCPVSGRPPNHVCPRAAKAFYIRGVSSSRKCSVHKKIFVSPDGRMSFCSGCIRGHDYKTKVIERYPPATTRFLKARGMLKDRVPPHSPDCKYYQTRWTELNIISPNNGAVFVRDARSRVPIKVASSQPAEPVYVFLDGQFVRALDPAETIFVRPEPGSHRVTAVDYTGNSTTHSFKVK